MHVGKDLLDNLWMMNCAEGAVFSLDTFKEAVKLRKKRFVVEFLDTTVEQRTPCMNEEYDTTYLYISDRILRRNYDENVRMNNWSNTAYQRSLVFHSYHFRSYICKRARRPVLKIQHP